MKQYWLLAGAMLLIGSLPGWAQTSPKAEKRQVYAAHLVPLNTTFSGHTASGELRVIVAGDTVTFALDAKGLPPAMTHMAHLHGFTDGKAAQCPSASSDINHDGILDLSETEPDAGTTMVPLNSDPAALQIAGKGYPKATRAGQLHYRKAVSLAALNKAMAANFHGASLDLSRRVVFLHGVPAATSLPKTAASLPGVPAQVTLPIACGQLEPVKDH